MKTILKIFVLSLLIISCRNENKNNLVIITDNNEIVYTVKEAVKPEDLAKGLMNVAKLPENEGMIFNLIGIKDAAMWMKDTLIPLDMIFVNNEGKIVWIFENAEAMSEDIIISPVPFDFVIELNAGQTRKNNIQIGNKIKHKFVETE